MISTDISVNSSSSSDNYQQKAKWKRNNGANTVVEPSETTKGQNDVSVEKSFHEKKYYIKNIRLSSDFSPGPYDVICGRGKTISQHSGNRRYCQLVKSIVPRSFATLSKLEKTVLVTSIIDRVEQASPKGGFVKEIGGVWYKVSESYAREKIGQSIRDALHTEYKSSSRAKAGRRKYKQCDETSNTFNVDLFDNITVEDLRQHFKGTSASATNQRIYESNDHCWQNLKKETSLYNLSSSMNYRGQRKAFYPTGQQFIRDACVRDSMRLPTFPMMEIAKGENRTLPRRPMADKLRYPFVSNTKESNDRHFELHDPDGLDLMVQTMVWEE